MTVDTTTATALRRAYRAGTLAPVDVVGAHLERLRVTEPVLNAFVLVDEEGALAAAEAAGRRWEQRAPMGPLDGVPVTVKDIVATAGWPTRSGSRTTSDAPGGADAPGVARLRESGAVIIGKTTTPEFGWKGITDSPLTGVTCNPWEPSRSPGGSSGGAAASLAAGVGAVAFGTDGGGSIRIPASYCGLVGLKPTFGRVPYHPHDTPFGLSVAAGPIANSVADAALLLNVLSRPDGRDPFGLPYDARDWRIGIEDGVAGLRVGATTGLGGAAVADPEIVAAWRAALDAHTDLGAHVSEVGPVFDPLRPRFEAHWKAGFAARLRTIPHERWTECDPGFVALAREGLAVDLAEFNAAWAARSELIATMHAFHADHDVLITPTMPTVAPPADVVYHSAGFDRWDHGVPFTLPFNLSGQPAASCPARLSSGGLPIGVQVVADHHREDLVLRVARALEAALPPLGRPSVQRVSAPAGSAPAADERIASR
jgi:aspartyl-tRNA(Asn)/glutamyl-tRNA(Gln) amidotransferase subunit A